MMMDGLDHPKTLDLAARLDASIPQVIGHLELLWAFVAQKTPRGNIGKWPDGTIARAAQWTADPSVFVTALHEAGFIDASVEHRFIIHDWPDHCPRWVKAKLKKLGMEFCTRDCSSDCSTDSSADSMPSHAKPSQAKPSEDNGTPAKAADAVSERKPYPDDFEQAWAEYPKREGGNPKKAAYKAWKARRAAGVPADELLQATRLYAQHCKAHGKTATSYVKQGSTFYGPDEHYRETYSTTAPKAPDRAGNQSHNGFESREYTSHLPEWARQAAGDMS